MMKKKYTTPQEQRRAAGKRQRDKARAKRTWSQNVVRALKQHRGK